MATRRKAPPPGTVLRQLHKAIEKGWKPGLTVLTGDDAYYLDAAQGALLEHLAPGDAAAFGLTVLTMAYAVGHISGCHLNPAVSLGLWAGGRFPGKDVAPYIVIQVLGAVVGAGVLYLIASGAASFDLSGGFASNGYGAHSPGGYSLAAGFVTELVMTFMFLVIILGATHKLAPAGFAGIPIGLGLTLIHLISIPVTNTSVNPARSTGVAVYVGGWAVAQLWLFWVAPIAGVILGALVYRFVAKEK